MTGPGSCLPCRLQAARYRAGLDRGAPALFTTATAAAGWCWERRHRRGLTGDAAHPCSARSAGQQDRPQRCARHRPDDAGSACSARCTSRPCRASSGGRCSQRASCCKQDARTRERFARHTEELRLQGWEDWSAGFEARVRELVPVLVARAALREQFKVLHALLLRLVRHDRACRPLMTAPAMGPVAAMTFRATIDLPARFRKSKAIGAHFGLTPRRHHLAR
jgi:hypothetical protein